MEKVAPPYGADLPLRKKPGNGNVPHLFPKHADIMVVPTEEPAASAATAEQQRAERGLTVPYTVCSDQKTQIFTGRPRVAKVELDGLPFLHEFADRYAAVGTIRAD